MDAIDILPKKYTCMHLGGEKEEPFSPQQQWWLTNDSRQIRVLLFLAASWQQHQLPDLQIIVAMVCLKVQ